jgi:acyl-CoA synthetase (AMP-forming)/AMP-acid ligase II
LIIPYGSTECLLVSVADSTTLPEPGPLGVCVGRPIAGHQVRIIAFVDEPIAHWHAGLELPPGCIGEITVAGPLVSDGYEGRGDLTALAKIDEGGRVVHRMGDLGALDEQGRLWLAGRTKHRVATPEGDVLPLAVEAAADAEPGVLRSALIAVHGGPWVVLELEPGADRAEVCARVGRRLAREAFSRPVREVRAVSRRFPVDTRHEVKIDRGALSAEWSAREARSTR